MIETGSMVVKQIAENTLNIKMEMLKQPKEMVSKQISKVTSLNDAASECLL